MSDLDARLRSALQAPAGTRVDEDAVLDEVARRATQHRRKRRRHQLAAVVTALVLGLAGTGIGVLTAVNGNTCPWSSARVVARTP